MSTTTEKPKRIILIEVHVTEDGTQVFSSAVADDLPPRTQEKVNDAVFFLMEKMLELEV